MIEFKEGATSPAEFLGADIVKLDAFRDSLAGQPVLDVMRLIINSEELTEGEKFCSIYDLGSFVGQNLLIQRHQQRLQQAIVEESTGLIL
jgi:hypothetical protein